MQLYQATGRAGSLGEQYRDSSTGFPPHPGTAPFCAQPDFVWGWRWCPCSAPPSRAADLDWQRAVANAAPSQLPLIGQELTSAATSDTAEDTGATRCSIPSPTAAATSFGSLFGGLQFGYNYLLPSRLLVGIEGDISFPNFLDDGIVTSRPAPTSTVTEKLDFVSTVRGRVGYAFDHWLFYGTGGASPGRKRGSLKTLA